LVDKNVIVETNPLNKQIAVWELHDGGDLHELMFQVPDTTSKDAIGKAFTHYGKEWVDMKRKDGWDIQAKTIRMHGPYPCLEFESLDMLNFVITARFKRSRPMMMSKEQFEPYLENDPLPEDDQRSIGAAILSAVQDPAEIEANARKQMAADKKAKEKNNGTRQ
jgi:hypothetical protein